jgi:hypothetical protein
MGNAESTADNVLAAGLGGSGTGWVAGGAVGGTLVAAEALSVSGVVFSAVVTTAGDEDVGEEESAGAAVGTGAVAAGAGVGAVCALVVADPNRTHDAPKAARSVDLRIEQVSRNSQLCGIVFCSAEYVILTLRHSNRCRNVLFIIVHLHTSFHRKDNPINTIGLQCGRKRRKFYDEVPGTRNSKEPKFQ